MPLIQRCVVLVLVAAVLGGGEAGRPDPSVFTAVSAPLVPRIRDGVPAPGGPLRMLTVEERVGVARRDELVRIPLFLHDGEGAGPDDFALYDATDTAHATPIPYQADDIRRTPDGALSRLHLWFVTDIKAWERRRFVLVRGTNPGAKLSSVPATVANGVVTLAGEELSLGFRITGPRAGTVASLGSPRGALTLPDKLLAPSLTLVRYDAKCAVVRSTPLSYAAPEEVEVRDLRWAAGPLFAKLVLRIGPKGVPDSVEYTYQIPRRGAEFTITERVFPEEADSDQVVGAKDNVLLGGRLTLGAATPALAKIPAGLRRLVRNVHNYSLPALVDQAAGLSLLAVPYVLSGDQTLALDGQNVQIRGPVFSRNGDANSGNLRSFWAQVRCVLTNATSEEPLWEAMRPTLQTLTAVVDEPGITAADFSDAMAEVAKGYSDIKYWGKGWQQSAAMDYLTRKTAAFEKGLAGVAAPAKPPKNDEATLEYWLPAWAKPAEGETASPPRPSGKVDTGRLDPYQISYGMSSIPSFARWFTTSERLDRICLAAGEASYRVNGVVDERGSPLITCFATALNMQIGTLHLALHGGLKLDRPDLVRFVRDTVHAQGVTAISGRGQRPYHSRLRDEPGGRTDALYEAIADLYLRSAELACDEDFWLHPAIYGRYADCIDVTADLQHRSLVDDGKRAQSWWRGNFFRTQSHDHRWEAWDSLPYIGMLGHAGETAPAGLTEAAYFLRRRIGRAVNWAELMPMYHTEINLTRGLVGWKPKPSPPLPGEVKTVPTASGIQLTWTAPVGMPITGYRIYRAERMGGPWIFMNSPHADPGKPAPANGALVNGTSFSDPAGKPGQVYWVTAVDAAGMESRWFADEPGPGVQR